MSLRICFMQTGLFVNLEGTVRAIDVYIILFCFFGAVTILVPLIVVIRSALSRPISSHHTIVLRAVT